jgi:hypothetical protein
MKVQTHYYNKRWFKPDKKIIVNRDIPDIVFVKDGKKYDTSKAQLISYSFGYKTYWIEHYWTNLEYDALYKTKNNNFFYYHLCEASDGEVIQRKEVLHIDKAYELYKNMEIKLYEEKVVFNKIICG